MPQPLQVLLTGNAQFDQIRLAMASQNIIGKQESYTRELKLDVLDWMASQHQSVRATAKKFAIDRAMIRRWKKQEQRILQTKKSTRKIGTGARPWNTKMETILAAQF